MKIGSLVRENVLSNLDCFSYRKEPLSLKTKIVLVLDIACSLCRDSFVPNTSVSLALFSH